MKVGLQPYTVRDAFLKDPRDTLSKMYQTGYKYAEAYNHNADNEVKCFGMTASELKKMGEETGVKIVSGHLGCYERAREMIRNFDLMKRSAEYYAELGCEYMVLSAEYFISKEQVYSSCEAYNRVGEICNEYGLTFLYHNHFWDFREYDGKAIMDILVEETDPDKMGVQVDAYWVNRGLIDPIAIIRKYGTRVKCIHQKDFPESEISNLDIWKRLDKSQPVLPDAVDAAVAPEQFTEIGTGILDIQGIINEGNAVGAKYVFLEQDYTKLPIFDSIRTSFDNYKKMEGLEI